MKNTYLLFLLIEVIDDYSYKQVKSEERSEDNEEYEVEIHVDVGFPYWLLVKLKIDTLRPMTYIQWKFVPLWNQ